MPRKDKNSLKKTMSYFPLQNELNEEFHNISKYLVNVQISNRLINVIVSLSASLGHHFLSFLFGIGRAHV